MEIRTRDPLSSAVLVIRIFIPSVCAGQRPMTLAQLYGSAEAWFGLPHMPENVAVPRDFAIQHRWPIGMAYPTGITRARFGARICGGIPPIPRIHIRGYPPVPLCGSTDV